VHCESSAERREFIDAEDEFMRVARSVAIGCLAGMMAVTPLAAHHSFAAEFDEHKPVTLKGILTRMEWANPHGWFYMDVTGPDGKVVNWAIEAGAPNALLRSGLRKTDFQPGLPLVVTGFLAKNGTPTANGRTVKFPDGREFFAGSSGNGAPRDRSY
jgi:hypothetical protein